MKNLINLEYLTIFVITSFLLLQNISFNWTVFLLIFFTPDLGALGLLINNRIGSYTYNFTHSYITGGIFLVSYWFFKNELLLTLGLLVFAHASFDRTLGYGLKYADSPDHTHLGYIGKSKGKNT